MAKYKNILPALVNTAKALAEEHRLRALAALRNGELCACHLSELLELAPSTVSRHMALLRAAGLVTSRKEGRWVYYRLAEPDTDSLADDTLAWLEERLAGDATLRRDARRLPEILKQEKDPSCRITTCRPRRPRRKGSA